MEQFWHEPAEVHISQPVGQSVQAAIPPEEKVPLGQIEQLLLPKP